MNEITDVYFNMRLPFEKEIPKIENLFTTEEMTEEEFEKLFKSKE